VGQAWEELRDPEHKGPGTRGVWSCCGGRKPLEGRWRRVIVRERYNVTGIVLSRTRKVGDERWPWLWRFGEDWLDHFEQ
jgi:hypothetical protein